MKVLVPIDESDGSFNALKWALDHLFNHPTDFITLLHVRQPFQPFIYPAGPIIYPTTAVVDAVKKAQEENATVIVNRALRLCEEKMIKAESLVLEGDPKDRICQVADDHHFDLLVIGSRGLGKLKRAFLGSVSDYCAHHASCPILIVKPPKEASMQRPG